MGAVVYGFRTSITDIRRFIEAATAFTDKVRAGLVTGRTGGTFHISGDDLTVIKGKVFLVVRYVSTHGEPPSTAVRRAGKV